MERPDRREFLLAALGAAAGLAAPAFGASKYLASVDVFPELVEATIPQLQSKLRSRELTSVKLTEMYLARIRSIDPQLHSVIEVNPDARSIAAERDAERKRGRVRSPLHGIPILIKDNIDTADKMRTTAGSLALVEAPRPKRDAFVVERLRRAGAVILGKTNLSEWANFRGEKSISGWSARGGQTNNPYFLDQNPCGSSSGSGVAVSANLAAAAVGTETNGSIICPAVANGVVGIKPTLGLVSRSGIIPIAHSQDTAGPMARTVMDAAIMLGAMVARDELDAASAPAQRYAGIDFTRDLRPDGLKGARLGVVMQFAGNAENKAYYAKAIDELRAAGAILVDVTFKMDPKLGAKRIDVLLYEFKADLNRYLGSRGGKYRTLEDLIKFNEEHKNVELTRFGQELFTRAQAKGDLSAKEYLEALSAVKRATQADGIDAVMAGAKVDALVAPTSGSTWSIAAVAGYPYITVPLGLRRNDVTGLGFFGKAFSDERLIKYAYAFEQRTKRREVPKLLPSYEN